MRRFNVVQTVSRDFLCYRMREDGSGDYLGSAPTIRAAIDVMGNQGAFPANLPFTIEYKPHG